MMDRLVLQLRLHLHLYHLRKRAVLSAPPDQ